MPIEVTIIAEETASLRPQSDPDYRLVTAPRAAWAEQVAKVETEVVAFLRNGFTANAIFVSQLKRAHRVSWSAVGPAVRLENPDLDSLTRHLERFGPWQVPASPMALPFLPEGLTSYKTEALKEFGLDRFAEDEYSVQAGLGGRLFLDPTLEVSHRDQHGGAPSPLSYSVAGQGLSRWDRWRLRLRLWRRARPLRR